MHVTLCFYPGYEITGHPGAWHVYFNGLKIGKADGFDHRDDAERCIKSHHAGQREPTRLAG